MSSIPVGKHGRKVLLGPELDERVKKCITNLHKTGTPIGSSVVVAAAEGMMMMRAYDRTLLLQPVM